MEFNYSTLKQQLFELRYQLKLVKEDKEQFEIKKQISEIKRLMVIEMMEKKKCDALKK